MRRAVFLDRDGTIVEDLDFLTDLSDLRLLPGAAEGIRKLNGAGFFVVVITNQSGVARGFLTEEKLQDMHRRLSEMLAAQGTRIDAYDYCPHHPSVGPPQYRINCECRKPKPGMFLRAAKKHGLDLAKSFAIGDNTRDAQAAGAAGIRAILVHTGPHREEAMAQPQLYVHQASGLLEATEWILANAAGPS